MLIYSSFIVHDYLRNYKAIFVDIFSAAQKKRVTQVSQMYNTGFTVGEVFVNVFYEMVFEN